jgi:hypothetical protein
MIKLHPLPVFAAAVSGLLVSASADGGFYGDPPDLFHPWAIHDMNRPQPPVVTPAAPSAQEKPGAPPSDAIVLFDGTEKALAGWEADKNPAEPTKWIVKDGTLQCVPGSGYARTKEQFGDCQLHVEWSAPSKVEGNSQGRGNSGVFLMGQVEVQVLDNFNNPSYADGMAGSVYGVSPPAANPLRAPGEWQFYDIVFRRPLFDGDKLIDPGYLTVFINGVLVQDHTPLEGGGGHRGRSKDRPFGEKGPLKLQDHGNPVRYRNIWYRNLPKRAAEGGTDGKLTEAAATAKKQEIAASLRSQAASKDGMGKLFGLMESLCYTPDEAALKEIQAITTPWFAEVKTLQGEKLEAKKGEIMHLHSAAAYLAKHKFVPASFTLADDLEGIIKANEWDKKK